MSWINDCVYCSNEDGNICEYFNENIYNPENTYDIENENNRARRMQNKCRGFRLDYNMKNSWEETFNR